MSNQPSQEKFQHVQQTILPKTIIEQIPSLQKKSQSLHQLKIKKQEELYNQDDYSNINNQNSTPLSSDIQASNNKIPKYKYRILTTQQKWQIVKQSWATSVKKAAKQYQVSPNNICRWRKGCQRKPGAGRKVTDNLMEAKLFQWFSQQKLGTLKKKTIQKKARQLSKNPSFKASKGWYQRFMKRNEHLSHYLIKQDPPKGLNPMINEQIQKIFKEFKTRFGNKIAQVPQEVFDQNKENMMVNEVSQRINSLHNQENQCKLQEQVFPLRQLFQSQPYYVKQQYIYDVLNLGQCMIFDEGFKHKK